MQNRSKESTGVAFLERRAVFRSPAEQQSSAPSPAFQAEICDPIRAFDHFKIVLNDNRSVSLVHQTLKDFQQSGHVVNMESSRRFIKDVEGFYRASVSKVPLQVSTFALLRRKECFRADPVSCSPTRLPLGFEEFSKSWAVIQTIQPPW